MPKNVPIIHASRLVLSDCLASATVWVLISLVRRNLLGERPKNLLALFFNPLFITMLVAMPVFWLALYSLAGAYNVSVYKKSRLTEFTHTFVQSFAGAVILLLLLFVNDRRQNYGYLNTVFFSLLFLQTVIPFAGRLFFIQLARKQLRNGRYFFNTLFIGNNRKAYDAYKEIKKSNRPGIHVVGFLCDDKASKNGMASWVPKLGGTGMMEKIIQEKDVHQVIISLDKTDPQPVENLISRLSEKDVEIKFIPETVEILYGWARVENIFGIPLIDIDTNPMPAWQRNAKRLLDILLSVTSAVALSPLLLFIAIKTKLSSPGPVIYAQERAGLKGKPFTIYKFRSMYDNAEPLGPALSSKDDIRVTPWGRFIRKWRLDELPQLWNIIKGEMSFVGPRPERRWYINQLNQLTPYYRYLLKVKPGLTSWGMVKFGYASTVEEMAERMKYDLVYMENISLLLDIKIMFYTLSIIFSGKGQ